MKDLFIYCCIVTLGLKSYRNTHCDSGPLQCFHDLDAPCCRSRCVSINIWCHIKGGSIINFLRSSTDIFSEWISTLMAIHTFAYPFLLNITLLTSSIYLLWLSKSYDVTSSQHKECVVISIYLLFLRYKFKPAPVTVSSGRNNFLTFAEEFKFSESLFEAGAQRTCRDVLSIPILVPPRRSHSHHFAVMHTPSYTLLRVVRKPGNWLLNSSPLFSF